MREKTLRVLDATPAEFALRAPPAGGTARLGKGFASTIREGHSVEEMVLRGEGFVSDEPKTLRVLAMSPDAFTKDLFFLAPGATWTSPAGAYKWCGGPI